MNTPADYGTIAPEERERWRRAFSKLAPDCLAAVGLPPDAMDRALGALLAAEIDRHALAENLCANGICASSTCPEPKTGCTECWELTAARHRWSFAKHHPRYSRLNL